MIFVRPYAPSDERAWLRCRVLSFLQTNYYDDVRQTRLLDDDLALALVAVDDDELLGLIDITIDGDAATIDCIAVHPEAQRSGIGTALLAAVLDQLPDHVASIDAWTREDPAANSWYRARGFTENFRYLHVYKNWDESADGFTSPDGLSAPVMAFLHAPIERERQLRERFARVYVCRQYLMQLPAKTS
jgi:ribosomal protein S18 acetylase RimI-like enzyme